MSRTSLTKGFTPARELLRKFTCIQSERRRSKTSISRNAGFTLTELLVSMAIIITIFTVITVKQSKYTEGIALQNVSADLGLTIREAQVYGISVKEFSPGSEEFAESHGVKFDITSSGSNDAYLLYADRDNNGNYDNDWSCPLGGTSECLRKTNINFGNYISELCYIENGNDRCTLGKIIINFVRPDTNAIFKLYNQAGSLVTPTETGIKIKMLSPTGLQKTIIVYKSGQVSLQQ